MKKSVLIVDDDRSMCENLEDILQEEDYIVFSALTCLEARKLALEHKPVVTFLDIKLPDGSGVDLLSELEQINPENYRIMMTAHADYDSVVSVLGKGAFQYLQKPVRPEELLQLLEQCFDQNRLREEKKRAEQALRDSEERFRTMVEANSDFIWAVGLDGVYTYVSPKVEDLLGYLPEEVVGRTPFDFMTPDEAERVRAMFQEIASSGRPFERLQNVNIHKDGKLVVLDTSGVPILDANGNLSGYRGIDRDITDSKRAEEELKSSLEEKEVLLREIHHRVKNNLQIISSLLNLQSGYIQDRQALDVFRESMNRIRTMALVHETLYRSRDLAKIDFPEYIKNLISYLVQAYSIDLHAVDIKTNIEDVVSDIDIAIPFGLILNELVSNTLKHAFPEGRGGEVLIEICPDGDSNIIVKVSDNGIGFPEEIDFRNTESLGLQLVMTLVGQLRGDIELEKGAGTGFRITFPANK